MQGIATESLGGFKTGMDRQSRRSSSDGAQRLYTLQNAYLNERGEALPRPGLAHIATVANSAGLYGWKGQLHVFHADSSFVDPGNPLVAGHTLPYPLANAPTNHAISQVHFVGVILGELYVAAEYADGTLKHFWLQNPPTWQPNHVYGLGDLVQPSTPNGYYYQAPLSAPVAAWQSSTVYAVGSQVQPSKPNGYVYQVVQVTGSSPTSGSSEPTWPVSEGAQVFEGTDSTTVPANGSTPAGGSTGINTVIRDRYNIDPGALQ